MQTRKKMRKSRLLKIIEPLAKSIQELSGQAIIEYSREADTIIAYRCKDRHRIEHTLDGMLDFCFDNSMLNLYKKLCRYYYGINPAATVDYVYAYRDMWDSPREEKQRLVAKPAKSGRKRE